MILAGDIGGTYSRLALFEKGKKIVERQYLSAKYPCLEKIVQEFMRSEKQQVVTASFGIAGPVRNGTCQMTNLSWTVNERSLSKILDIPVVHLLNDLEANAYSLRKLNEQDCYLLQKGDFNQKGNQALIAAGTGLGEAGLFWDGQKHHPFACEGGHADFAPKNEDEIELFLYVRKKVGRVSCERIISGSGLFLIFQFLIETKRAYFASRIQNEMRERDPSVVIFEWGSKNEDSACVLALEWFVSCFGAEAGNLALKFLSLGGFYIGGGIAPRILNQLTTGLFLRSFLEKGRFKELLASIPVRVILHDNTTLLGAVVYAESLDPFRN